MSAPDATPTATEDTSARAAATGEARRSPSDEGSRRRSIAAREFVDDDGRADERVSLTVSDDDRWAVAGDECEQNDGSLIDERRRHWAAEARATGRASEARALEVHEDDPPDAERVAEDELLAGIRREEPDAPTW